jgi:hypothetical protein
VNLFCTGEFPINALSIILSNTALTITTKWFALEQSAI